MQATLLLPPEALDGASQLLPRACHQLQEARAVCRTLAERAGATTHKQSHT